MTHICVSKLTIIASDNGLSPGRRQAIIWTSAGILLIGPLGTNLSEILIEIITFSFKKMRLNVSSAKWRPCCLGLNVLTWIKNYILHFLCGVITHPFPNSDGVLGKPALQLGHGLHDDVIKWKHFPRYWPFVRGIHRSPLNSPHKGQWRGALMFTLICVWINGCVNSREAGDLRRYGAHYDVTVMDHYVIKVLCMGVNILLIIKTTINGMNLLTIALLNDDIINHPCPNTYG